MTLKQRLDDEELALLEILEDPIWLGEFLHTTSDGEPDKELWPTESWKYRDYQRQFLTDKSEFILYTGGRAIGKCQPSGSRIYTTEGYKTISELSKRKYFITYALDNDMSLVQRRALITRDKVAPAYTVITESGHKFVGTDKHPLLTPGKIFKPIALLSEGDYVAVVTRLPHDSTNAALQWHELRILGYIFLKGVFRAEHKIKPRYRKIGAELEAIADRMILNWHKDFDGYYSLHRKPGPFKHPITSLLDQCKLFHPMRQYGVRKIPNIIKAERSENIQVFLEAVFAQYAELTAKEISLNVPHEQVAMDFQELLLRFGIESKIIDAGSNWRIELLDYRAVYRFWKTFTIPGITVGQQPLPPATLDTNEHLRFERIKSIHQSHLLTDTYAVHVYDHENYIGDNLYVHNSIVLEDKMVYDVVNSFTEFPVTPEMVLVTANQSQMTPLQNRLITRFTSSRLLKDYLRNNINKSTGIMTFPRRGKPFIFTMRIAGSRGENNMVGLHVPKLIGDEMQLFPLPAWTQLQPTYNSWEAKRQQIQAGVPNGLRNSVLYVLDMQTPKYKKYRIPAPNNPYYSYENYQDDLRRYGGESDDRFQQLVLGRHGSAAFQVIPRESIVIETFPFYNMRYNSAHVLKGIRYDEILQRPKLPEDITKIVIAIDPGFVDPTLIQVLGRDKKGIWRTYIRYRLTRIDFNEQQKIFDWLATFYNASLIALDVGAGGNGAAMMHNLINGDEYKGKSYDKRIMGIQFKENILAGYDDEGEELFQDAKGFAANDLARTIQEKRLVFSEVDNEGISQMERIAKKKNMSGRDQYFVLSDRGTGVDEDDHIFASYICFVLGIREEPIDVNLKKLGLPKGSMT